MNEILMEAILEKLDNLEVFLKTMQTGKQPTIDMSPVLKAISDLKSSVAVKSGSFPVPENKVIELQQSISELLSQLRVPVNNKTEHKHHLHKGIWLSAGLFLATVFLICGWWQTSEKLEQYQAGDIKYRYSKIYGNPSLSKFCAETDSLYLKDGSVFTNWVEHEEQRLIQLAEVSRLAGEKKERPGTGRPVAGQKREQ